MTIVLDSGAFIAVEKNDPLFKTLLAIASEEATDIFVPATVVAETWRGSPRNAKTAILMTSIDRCVPLDLAAARETGVLLAKSKNGTVIDANVVSIAIANRPSTIVTSDPGDIERLLQSANVAYAHEDPSEPKADVIIITV